MNISKEFALEQDHNDELAEFRSQYLFPRYNGKNRLYFTGNSLGLQPKSTKKYLQDELDKWSNYAVDGHFKPQDPWMYYHHLLTPSLCKIVGGKPDEVCAMNTLSVNLNLLLISFYRPTAQRYKIIIEKGAFPSDQYAVQQQIKFHGYYVEDALIELAPEDGKHLLTTDQIQSVIQAHGETVACVMLGGINYYTGQVYDMEAITKTAHSIGATCGFDLAHAAGNIPLELHNWNVDFACWCTYKYMNSSPGGISGIYVHEKHHNNHDLPKLAGWWGNKEKNRFEMKDTFDPIIGAGSWQMSNQPILLLAAHRAALELFDRTSMAQLRKKSIRLNNYLMFLVEQLNENQNANLNIITPKDEHERGAQLSILTDKRGRALFEHFEANGVTVDWRNPDVIRIAPAPMYNSFEDVYNLYQVMLEFYSHA